MEILGTPMRDNPWPSQSYLVTNLLAMPSHQFQDLQQATTGIMADSPNVQLAMLALMPPFLTQFRVLQVPTLQLLDLVIA